MGQEGALLTAKDEPESLYVTTNPKIYDEGAVGTGDAMVGAIANAMHAGMKFDEVARYAVAMGRACAVWPAPRWPLSRRFTRCTRPRRFTSCKQYTNYRENNRLLFSLLRFSQLL